MHVVIKMLDSVEMKALLQGKVVMLAKDHGVQINPNTSLEVIKQQIKDIETEEWTR
jgi:DhnA family fructose-bisphosphate aldolase class Ia